MLRHLHIRNFAIVPSLDLDIPVGFTAITGETGAGKSILVDAIGLLLGDRSDASWVRTNSERAELSAEFSIDRNPEAQRWLEELELLDDDVCLLRRTIDASGRSRAYINGSPVTVGQLQSLGELLVELHGQNQHLQLGKKAEQLRLLDSSGDYDLCISQVADAYKAWQEKRRSLEELEQDSGLSGSDLSFLQFQLEELDQFDLDAKAIVELQQEHDRLASGGELLESLSYAIEQLDPESGTSDSGINAGLHQIAGQLETFTELDKRIKDAHTMLSEAAVNCEEACNALNAARDRVDLDPRRLEQLADSIGQLHDLARKHRVRMEGLEEVRDSIADRIARAENSGQRRLELEAQLEKRLSDYRHAAALLHEARNKHAAELTRQVTGLMTELGMAGGVFDLNLQADTDASPTQHGDDRVDLQISANPGQAPGPLRKIASGGELSRISLAIKVAAIGNRSVKTQIFDEVDAGIGGKTASAVGRLMARLSRASDVGPGQALCVTHLAQVAVCASQQILVDKIGGKSSTNVSTHLLEPGARIDEIARMLSGTISAQSRAHAAELLEAASKETQKK